MDIKTLFLKALWAFIRGENVKEKEMVLEEKEWEELFDLASMHHILPMVYEIAMEQESFQKLSTTWKNSWRQKTLMIVARQAYMTSEFLHLYQNMKKTGLSPLVVKGIVCRNMYGKPDYRFSSDEDLLVQRSEFFALDHFLLKEGFQRKEEEEELKENIDLLHEVGYRNPKTGLYLEIHLSLFPEESGVYGDFNRLFDKAEERSISLRIEEMEVNTLSETDHFLYLICHSAKHFYHSGFGVRQVLDILLFAEQYGKEINWDYVVEKTKEERLYLFMIHLFDIGIKQFAFDVKKANWTGENLTGTLDTEALLNDLLVGGIYGSSSEERLHSANITLAAADKVEKKGKLFQALFPDRHYMREKYPYVKKYSWLLPFGWVQRWLEFLWKSKTNSKKIIETGEKRIAILRKYGMIS